MQAARDLLKKLHGGGMAPPRTNGAAAFLDGYAGKVLVGMRTPYWKCKHRSTFDNWASRLVCRMSEGKAPAEVAKKAWDESRKPPAARRGERPTRPPRSGGKTSRGEVSEAKPPADQQDGNDQVEKLQATLDALKASPPADDDASAAEAHGNMLKF